MNEPLQVWPGCLSCYASGRLVGIWIDAIEAGSLSIEELHRLAGARLYPDCEEVLCLDHSGFPPGTGEIGLSEAQEWGDAYAEVDSTRWPALSAWVASGAYIACGHGDVPSPSDFEERYRGEWDDLKAYAQELVEESGMMTGWPEMATSYFDWDRYVRDLAYDYTTEATGRGTVYVFLNP